MLVRMQTSSGSGGGVSGSLYADTSDLIHTLNTVNTSWTATQDCIMIGRIQLQAGVGYGALLLDNITVIDNVYNSLIGDKTSAIGFFIPKNTEVKTGTTGAYSLEFFGLA